MYSGSMHEDKQKNMAENPTRSKPGRKPSTPSVDSIRRALERGEYDDYLHDIDRAINARRDELKESVMARVRDVFGPDAVITLSKSGVEASHPVKNPFVKKAEAKAEQGEHQFRIDPSNGNAMRLVDDPDEQEGDSYTICDVLGGHLATLPKSEFESWPLAKSDVKTVDEPLSDLDKMEHRMAAEDQGNPPEHIRQEVMVDIERRGASISGMHSSDMGDT